MEDFSNCELVGERGGVTWKCAVCINQKGVTKCKWLDSRTDLTCPECGGARDKVEGQKCGRCDKWNTIVTDVCPCGNLTETGLAKKADGEKCVNCMTVIKPTSMMLCPQCGKNPRVRETFKQSGACPVCDTKLDVAHGHCGVCAWSGEPKRKLCIACGYCGLSEDAADTVTCAFCSQSKKAFIKTHPTTNEQTKFKTEFRNKNPPTTVNVKSIHSNTTEEVKQTIENLKKATQSFQVEFITSKDAASPLATFRYKIEADPTPTTTAKPKTKFCMQCGERTDSVTLTCLRKECPGNATANGPSSVGGGDEDDFKEVDEVDLFKRRRTAVCTGGLLVHAVVMCKSTLHLLIVKLALELHCAGNDLEVRKGNVTRLLDLRRSTEEFFTSKKNAAAVKKFFGVAVPECVISKRTPRMRISMEGYDSEEYDLPLELLGVNWGPLLAFCDYGIAFNLVTWLADPDLRKEQPSTHLCMQPPLLTSLAPGDKFFTKFWGSSFCSHIMEPRSKKENNAARLTNLPAMQKAANRMMAIHGQSAPTFFSCKEFVSRSYELFFPLLQVIRLFKGLVSDKTIDKFKSPSKKRDLTKQDCILPSNLNTFLFARYNGIVSRTAIEQKVIRPLQSAGVFDHVDLQSLSPAEWATLRIPVGVQKSLQARYCQNTAHYLHA